MLMELQAVKGRAADATEAVDQAEAEATRLGGIVHEIKVHKVPTGVEWSAVVRLVAKETARAGLEKTMNSLLLKVLAMTPPGCRPVFGEPVVEGDQVHVPVSWNAWA